MANEYDDKVLALRKSVPQADTGESDTGAPDTGERRVSPGVERQYQLQKMYEAYKADPDKGRFSSPAEWLKNRQAEQEEIRQVVGKLEAPQTTPVANYRVTASHMKDPVTGDPYALIETEYDYGEPGGARGTRKIQIGDELPEGSVTNITTEGITVIPPEEGDEFVLPIGHGTAPKPGKKTHTAPPLYDFTQSHINEMLDQLRMRETWEKEREDSGGEDPEVPPEVLSEEHEAALRWLKSPEVAMYRTVGPVAPLFTPDLLAAKAESYGAEDEPPSYLDRRERLGEVLEEPDALGTFDERFPFEPFESFEPSARFGGFIDKIDESEDGL